MTYTRKKARGNKRRTVAGYTRSDGAKVSSYTRKKARGNTRRTVKRKK